MAGLVDTHCHIHEAVVKAVSDEFMSQKWQKLGKTPEEMLIEAQNAGVETLLCVGTTLADSKLAVEFARKHHGVFATIGIHPHEAQDHNSREYIEEFAQLASDPKVVGVGECGLDYYYNNSPKKHQKEILEFQLKLAQKHDLPLVFHVRDSKDSAEASVWDDFFGILSDFAGIRGVIHSFTANTAILDKCLQKGLYIGLNGIMTFTKDDAQLAAAKAVPLRNLLLETDAPFLTPAPHRGTICQPKHVRVTAEFLSNLRHETLEELSTATTQNAMALFGLKN